MSYKTLVSMNIAIIGSGETAEYYTAGFAFAGHNILLAAREGDKNSIHSSILQLTNVTVCSIEDAAYRADLVIIATEPKDVREVSYWLGDVRSKVIIDVTSNVHTPEEELVKTVCGIKAITGSQHVVKAFNTAGYENILSPLFKNGKTDLMLVGESKKAKEITKILALELGLESFYDFGGAEAIELFNEMTRCWRKMLLNQVDAKLGKSIAVKES